MTKGWKRWWLLPLVSLFLFACGVIESPEEIETTEADATDEVATVVEGEAYDTAEEVAMYLSLYGELPENYLTKDEARALGWVAQEGNLWEVAPGASIGGDYFGNFEGLLPESANRDYYEADIEYDGGHRNAKRLVFSTDGLFFYTEDHYDSFEEIELEENSQ